MSLILASLEIPEQPTDLPRWLEEHLTGTCLGQLVAELEAIHGTTGVPPLESVLPEDKLQQVIAQGLGSLPAEQLQQLLAHPRLLLQLQERILLAESPYWEPLLQREQSSLAETSGTETLREQVKRSWELLQPRFRHSETTRLPARTDRRVVWAVVVTAAVVLVAVWGGQPWWWQRLGLPRRQAAADWGWLRPDALPQELSASEYLLHLAQGAQAWFNRRPENPQALAKRILEFRQGCTRLILSRHKPLSPEDQKWLHARCRTWAAKIDQQLAALESGTEPLQVREEMDRIVRRVVQLLRQRAEEARG